MARKCQQSGMGSWGIYESAKSLLRMPSYSLRPRTQADSLLTVCGPSTLLVPVSPHRPRSKTELLRKGAVITYASQRNSIKNRPNLLTRQRLLTLSVTFGPTGKTPSYLVVHVPEHDFPNQNEK